MFINCIPFGQCAERKLGNISGCSKKVYFLLQSNCIAFEDKLCRQSKECYECAAFFCFSTLQVFSCLITPAKTRFKHIRNRLLRSAYIVTIMTVMCGLEPLFKGSQLLSSRQPVASPLSASSQALSTASLRQTQERLQEGDIIRIRSPWLTRLSAPATASPAYAQAGIITFERSQPMVITPSPEDADVRLVKEPIADFLQGSETSRAAIYRLKTARPAVQHAITAAAKSYAANASSHATLKPAQDQGGCTDFVRCAYLEAGIDLANRDLESFSWPLQKTRPTPFENVSLRPVYPPSRQSLQPAVP